MIKTLENIINDTQTNLEILRGINYWKLERQIRTVIKDIYKNFKNVNKNCTTFKIGIESGKEYNYKEYNIIKNILDSVEDSILHLQELGVIRNNNENVKDLVDYIKDKSEDILPELNKINLNSLPIPARILVNKLNKLMTKRYKFILKKYDKLINNNSLENYITYKVMYQNIKNLEPHYNMIHQLANLQQQR